MTAAPGPRRHTLLDFFEDFASRPDVFLVHDDGYRVRQATYQQVAGAARAFAAHLTRAGVAAGDTVVIWSENRPEWIVALWGTLLARAVLVPIDYRASADLLARVTGIVGAKAVLVGQEVAVPPALPAPVWPLHTVIDLSAAAPGATTASSTPAARAAPADVLPTSLAEIIFTSGATADPKGVTITHKNLLANIVPIEREIRKYLRYVRPFHPIRFLNLLPLSHMFGQSMATFVPPMLGGTVVFSHGYSPAEILRQISSRRVSVLVAVPKVLDVLREHVQRTFPLTREADVLSGRHFAWRWWRYRQVHSAFGWKFWCIVCGAAPLDPELEAFWRQLGFLVVQGYGLTETAPIVTLNHPFRAAKGSVGTPIGGVKIKIADDGEILVRGDNVTEGYYQAPGRSAPAESAEAFRDGWFHTGDIGELDPAGRLVIKGRKKEMIVTPQGLNVFPEDVERAIAAQPGVVDCGVIGRRVEGEERIHAVLVLAPGTTADAVVRGANQSLEDHQRIWSTSIWPADRLPRTEGTQKLKRRELQRWVAGEASPAAAGTSGHTLFDVVARFAPNRDLSPETTLDELGLSSLDRVEMMMAIEEACHTTIDEQELAVTRTLADLERLASRDLGGAAAGRATPGASPSTSGSAAGSSSTPAATSASERGPESPAANEPIAFPSWNRTRAAWFLRRISLPTWILPLGRPFMQMRVEGLEHLRDVEGPVVFAANHQSHLDVPAIMMALPTRWRYWLAPAMAKEFFKAHFYPARYTRKQWFTNSLNYYLSCQFFNAFPLPQREAGTRQTLRYIGEVTGSGYSVLIFPEGKRTEQGEIIPFKPGIGMIGARLGLPVVPVRLEGLDRVLHQRMKWPVRGPIRVAFGAPLLLEGDDYAALARRVEEAVREL